MADVIKFRILTQGYYSGLSVSAECNHMVLIICGREESERHGK